MLRSIRPRAETAYTEASKDMAEMRSRSERPHSLPTRLLADHEIHWYVEKMTSRSERSHSLPTRLSAEQEIHWDVEKMVGLELQSHIERNKREDSDLLTKECLRLLRKKLVERGVQLYKAMQATDGGSHSHLMKRLRNAVRQVSRLFTRKEIAPADIERQSLRNKFDRPPTEQTFKLLPLRLPTVLKRS